MKERAFTITLELNYDDHIEIRSVIKSSIIDFAIFVQDIKKVIVKEGYILVTIRGRKYDEDIHSNFEVFQIKGRQMNNDSME